MVSVREVGPDDRQLYVHVDFETGNRCCSLRELSDDMIDMVEQKSAASKMTTWTSPNGHTIVIAEAIAEERRRRVLNTWLAVAYGFEPGEGIFSAAMTVGDLATTPLLIGFVWRGTFTTKTEAEACCELHDPDQDLDGWEHVV